MQEKKNIKKWSNVGPVGRIVGKRLAPKVLIKIWNEVLLKNMVTINAWRKKGKRQQKCLLI